MDGGSANNLSMTHPLLTGESRRDWSLWQLSCILGEIAEQTKQENSSDISGRDTKIQGTPNRTIAGDNNG
jgi:hypothetical protein